MIYILLPAYNEEKNIEAVLDGLDTVLNNLKQDFRIIIVNDGSTDRTKDILLKYSRQKSVEAINFKSNLGIGAVFRTGISRIGQRATDDDILVTMDCDQTHQPEILTSLLKALEDGNQVVIASRYHKMSQTINLPYLREFLSNGINLLLKIVFPIEKARDYTTFFRAYRMSILKKALLFYGNDFIQSPGFSAMAEILIKLRIFKPKVCEVGLKLRFDLRTGKSKMNIRRTIFGYLLLISRELQSRISGVFRKSDI